MQPLQFETCTAQLIINSWELQQAPVALVGLALCYEDFLQLKISSKLTCLTILLLLDEK